MGSRSGGPRCRGGVGGGAEVFAELEDFGLVEMFRVDAGGDELAGGERDRVNAETVGIGGGRRTRRWRRDAVRSPVLEELQITIYTVE
jgi:hypothetical protein